MPRFYFDTKLNGSVFEDPEGADFETLAAAKHEALAAAAAFTAERLLRGNKIQDEEKIVRSENGETVARFKMRDALKELAAQA